MHVLQFGGERYLDRTSYPWELYWTHAITRVKRGQIRERSFSRVPAHPFTDPLSFDPS